MKLCSRYYRGGKRGAEHFGALGSGGEAVVEWCNGPCSRFPLESFRPPLLLTKVPRHPSVEDCLTVKRSFIVSSVGWALRLKLRRTEDPRAASVDPATPRAARALRKHFKAVPAAPHHTSLSLTLLVNSCRAAYPSPPLRRYLSSRVVPYVNKLQSVDDMLAGWLKLGTSTLKAAVALSPVASSIFALASPLPNTAPGTLHNDAHWYNFTSPFPNRPGGSLKADMSGSPPVPFLATLFTEYPTIRGTGR
ncbi:unnamed protein product [Nezara viridula]|uniref:Uncharacterized protein n=1 Tax=Nezara viridula TaxID=85310 RepID=A0A9P0E891_NEZVI|nr:unnamed protein product [Nezara viridula]